jgi:Calcineurin-like phosphoesterase
MNKSRFRLTGFARRNGPVLTAAAAALSLLAVMLLLPLTTSGTVSSGTFINDTLTNDTINSFGGDPSSQQQQLQPPLDDFNFAAAGDWGCQPNSPQTVTNIIDRSPELVLGLGDYSYMPSADCWFKVIDPIDSLTKITFGNHDVVSSDLTNEYLNHFGLEKQYYSFNYQNVHFLVVSSEIPYNVGSAQYKFAENDLAAAASNSSINWIVAYHHKMEYTSESRHSSESGLRQALHPLFDKYGVDLVLQAHNHSYERTYPIQYDPASPSSPTITDSSTGTYDDPKGVIYVTVGTGGASESKYSDEKAYSIIQWIGHGFLNIDVVNNGLTMNGTLYSNDDDTVKDSFTIDKSGSTVNGTSGDSSTA